MRIYRHIPQPLLSQYIHWLWYYVDYYPESDRQHVLPDGTFELIINLEDRPRKLFDRVDPSHYETFKRAWFSGTHAGYLVIDALPHSTMIGAHFKPGGAAPFLGLPAGELSEQVVELEALWGHETRTWSERLQAAGSPQSKFSLLEQLLLERLARPRRNGEVRNSVAWALDRFVREPHLQSIHTVSNEIGLSHKHFIEQFRREVGLTPKLFCRIRRFQQVLVQIQNRNAVNWADVACSCGYFDQAHFVNDFVAFAGVNPSRYLRERLEDPNYVNAPLR